MSGEKSRGGVLTGQRLTLVITNLIKLAGVVIAVHEAFGHRDPVTFATAGFMMAGAQFSEELILGIVSRFFATQSLPPPSHPVEPLAPTQPEALPPKEP